jgi:acyl dehydratase
VEAGLHFCGAAPPLVWRGGVQVETVASPKLSIDRLAPGQRFSAGPHEVTEAAIRAFAEAFDPQVFHLDPEAAEATIFKGLAASGWHTAAITMRLLVEGGAPAGEGIVGLGGEIAWPRPVRPGDFLRVESEIIEVLPSRSKPDQSIVTIRTLTFNQANEIVQTLTSKVIAYRKR